MGIWLLTHIVTTTDASLDLERLAEILPDASVQTIPLCFDWGCRTFQTASHVNVLIYELFECLLRLWMGIWLPTNMDTTTDASPDLLELAKNLLDASVQTMQLLLS